MIFEVFRGNQRLFYNEDLSCVPDIEILKTMIKSGLKIKKDNKIYTLPKNKKTIIR